jgi:hypothetical protein
MAGAGTPPPPYPLKKGGRLVKRIEKQPQKSEGKRFQEEALPLFRDTGLGT